MSAAFTPEEQLLIRQDLIKVGKKYLQKYGLRKTSIDQLIAEVGISKGAFYKFFESKEHLFFVVIEELHNVIYEGASQILKDSSIASPEERLEKAILYAYNIINETSLLTFIKEELPLIFRKLPPAALASHQAKDSSDISSLLSDLGIEINYSPEFLGSLIRGIFCIAREKELVGETYCEEVTHFLIHNTCTTLLKDAHFTSEFNKTSLS